MMNLTLEQRVAALEQQVAELTTHQANGATKKPWMETIGMFTNDEGMKEIFDEAMRLREKDRRNAYRRYDKKAARRAKK
jgi:hypothetical protein